MSHDEIREISSDVMFDECTRTTFLSHSNNERVDPRGSHAFTSAIPRLSEGVFAFATHISHNTKQYGFADVMIEHPRVQQHYALSRMRGCCIRGIIQWHNNDCIN